MMTTILRDDIRPPVQLNYPNAVLKLFNLFLFIFVIQTVILLRVYTTTIPHDVTYNINIVQSACIHVVFSFVAESLRV